MGDLLYLGIIIVFFAASLGLVWGCRRLMEG